MLQEEGIVVRTFENFAIVRTEQSSACSAGRMKSSCIPAEGSYMNEVQVLNPLGAKSGDKVLIEISSKAEIKTSFLIYIIPIIALFSGGAAGHLISLIFFNSVNSDMFSILFSFVFLTLSFIFLKFINNKITNKNKLTPTIVQIMQ